MSPVSEMRIARVFVSKTNMSPRDDNAYFGMPGLYTPKYDQVHISVTFTWDLPKVEILKQEWSRYGQVKVGGPALEDAGDEFVAGQYLKEGVTITSRGCPYDSSRCPFCFVPKREGQIRELPIVPGNIVQDNNLLACSKTHRDKVFAMLRMQKRIDFAGGLEAGRVTDSVIEQLRSLKIHQIWLSYDRAERKADLVRVVEKLKRYFPRDKIRCYVLIGYQGDTLTEAEGRLKEAWDIGTLPFAMRYRTSAGQWEGTYLFNERQWNLLTRKWTRPAATKASMNIEGSTYVPN